ncbi:electron transport complex subunit RsxE [Chitinivibrio alkaliphilus]|uniref:Ion-translocating oxidoreductase complex subunit E n=1 Tax=Chitinivibrio alkaliphilus ACht1 TaxID=1313304 RepID=U7DCG9_9BACT|nr:electron transport complex subunit E [Chitinivibrio alkaliphilus]ERP32125.1 electron transport complex, RnfABCDGE type, E subunit [Chitinivibrio alkaliphilus ACht1]
MGNKIISELKRGILEENPIFTLALGLCPALGVSTSLENGLGMGLATTFVLLAANTIVSLIKNVIPTEIRIPCYIIIIATFVTIVQLVMGAYFPALNERLGIFIPLIVVNCLILGRAEAFASKHGIFSSIIDALVMGAGFTIGLVCISSIRELLGANTLWGIEIIPSFEPMTLFILAPGGFFTIGFIIAGIRAYKLRNKELH